MGDEKRPDRLLRQRRHRRRHREGRGSSAARPRTSSRSRSVGWFARCKDTEGNAFSLFQSDESAQMPEALETSLRDRRCGGARDRRRARGRRPGRGDGELGDRVGVFPAIAFSGIVVGRAQPGAACWSRSSRSAASATSSTSRAWLWIGGALSVLIVLAITVAPPHIGVTATIGIIIALNLAVATAIDRFGLFGYDRIGIGWTRVVGVDPARRRGRTLPAKGWLEPDDVVRPHRHARQRRGRSRRAARRRPRRSRRPSAARRRP